ncbi:hypothetical protein ColLi_06241 [Colletotrichum liriopes]|uniref:Uncharacterized protein n=1 Tax=Colletotrichum liriopes TaxID=708192 RepID=A0AA37GLW7_9PEZI|nr:hypothetical protein ColLi_06241 [Colletotrichum liriopes]
MALVRGEIQIGHAPGADVGAAAWWRASQIDTPNPTVVTPLSVDANLGSNGNSAGPSLDNLVVPPISSDGLAIRRHHFIVVCLWGEDRYMYTAEKWPVPQLTRAENVGFQSC